MLSFIRIISVILYILVLPSSLFGQLGKVYYKDHRGNTQEIYIQFLYNKGTCTLQNGDVLEGFFKFSDTTLDLDDENQIIVEESIWQSTNNEHNTIVLYKSNLSSKEIRKITIDQIKWLNVVGSNGLCSHKKETKYTYNQKHKRLLRLVHQGETNLYDESLVVNEIKHQSLYINDSETLGIHKPKELLNYYFSAYSNNPNISYIINNGIVTKSTKSIPNWSSFNQDLYDLIESSKNYYIEEESEIKKIKSLKQFDQFFKINDDIRSVAIKHRKTSQKDIFTMALYTLNPSIKDYILRHFTELKVYFKNDSILQTKGLIPLANWSLAGNNDILILTNDSLKIIDLKRINKVEIDEKVYLPIKDKLYKKMLLGLSWKHHGQNYAVCTYSKNQNVFNYNDKGILLIYELQESDKWKLKENNALIKAFINERTNY